MSPGGQTPPRGCETMQRHHCRWGRPPMKTPTDHLAQYAAYHRDPRNIHTHFVGVPMIMLAVVMVFNWFSVLLAY